MNFVGYFLRRVFTAWKSPGWVDEPLKRAENDLERDTTVLVLAFVGWRSIHVISAQYVNLQGG